MNTTYNDTFPLETYTRQANNLMGCKNKNTNMLIFLLNLYYRPIDY